MEENKKLTKEQFAAAQKGDVKSLLKGLDKKSLETLTSILKDEQRTKEILASKQAQEIISKLKLKKDNNNG
jgi:hypothetical protein